MTNRLIFTTGVNSHQGDGKEAPMTTFEATLIIVALFAFRFAVPLVLTLLFGYGMNYLLSRGSGQVEPRI
jgi:hypothetical protein